MKLCIRPFKKKLISKFQIDGFLFLLIGSALYNEIIDFPCSSQAANEAEAEVRATTPISKEDGKLLIGEITEEVNLFIFQFIYLS